MKKKAASNNRAGRTNISQKGIEGDSASYQLLDNNDKTLLFESRFESGNLYLAQKVTDNEYNLLMQNDINT